MRITRATTWLVTLPPGTFLLVELEDAEGTTGWGEVFTLPLQTGAQVALVHRMAGELPATDGTPEGFRRHILAASDNQQGNTFHAARNGIDMALWDLAGKRAGRPVCDLLGGPRRDDIAVYLNIIDHAKTGISDTVDHAVAAVKAGHRALKFYPLLAGRTPDEAGTCMAEVRAAVGDGIDLALDLWCPEDPEVALATARAVAPHRPYWFEEPCLGDDIPMLQRMRRETGLPIVTGERQCGTLHFDNLLAFGAADIFNPDICGMGGMAEMQYIAAAAARHGVRLSPHCWNSPAVGGSAMVQFCLQFPQAEMAEFATSLFHAWDGLAEVDYTIADGRARLGGRPGLGVTPDTTALRRLSDIHTTTLQPQSFRVSP